MNKYIVILTSPKSGHRPTKTVWDSFDEAYEQFANLAHGSGYTGKVPTKQEVKSGFSESNFYGFRVRHNINEIIIFAV